VPAMANAVHPDKRSAPASVAAACASATCVARQVQMRAAAAAATLGTVSTGNALLLVHSPAVQLSVSLAVRAATACAVAVGKAA
jgi:hypothetical protein